jgi:hypothetical protein
MRSVTEYDPAVVVAVFVVTPVASLVTVTVAPDTTAPDVSVTVPFTPLKACACTRTGKIKVIEHSTTAIDETATIRACPPATPEDVFISGSLWTSPLD